MASVGVLPPGTTATPEPIQMVNTLAGHMTTEASVTMTGLRLPEFDRNIVIDERKFKIFTGPCKYDIIFGADFLTKLGIKLDYANLEVEFAGIKKPMNTDGFTRVRLDAFVYNYQLQMEEELFEDDFDGIDSYASAILDAKYEPASANEIIKDHCSHLQPNEQDDLRKLFEEQSKLFDGSLGTFDGPKMGIDLIEGAKPVYKRYYPAPCVHLETFKKEIEHLVAIGVLSCCCENAYEAPTFIVPKKDGRVRVVPDMRELNKIIKPTNYSLPIITDTLQKHHDYKYFTKIDISMQYNTFELTEEANNMCVITTPSGNYRYERAPMGLQNTPSFAQARMEELLRDIPECDVYIDDISIFTDTWGRHVEVVDEVLTKLEVAGFTVNPLKCKWGVQETDWLGY